MKRYGQIFALYVLGHSSGFFASVFNFLSRFTCTFLLDVLRIYFFSENSHSIMQKSWRISDGAFLKRNKAVPCVSIVCILRGKRKGGDSFKNDFVSFVSRSLKERT